MFPQFVRFLLNLFHNPETNRHNAQLVFTTHDTTVLDQTLMRRDQVWRFTTSRRIEVLMGSDNLFHPGLHFLVEYLRYLKK